MAIEMQREEIPKLVENLRQASENLKANDNQDNQIDTYHGAQSLHLAVSDYMNLDREIPPELRDIAKEALRGAIEVVGGSQLSDRTGFIPERLSRYLAEVSDESYENLIRRVDEDYSKISKPHK